MVRRRAQAGAKIIVVSTEKTGLAHHPNAILLQLQAGTDTALLAGLMSAVLPEGAAPTAKGLDALKKALVSVESASSTSGVSGDQITAAAKAYAAAKNPVVVLGTGISASEEASLQALNLALLKNAGVVPLMLEANALGVIQMGCLSGMDAGFTKAKKPGKTYAEMKKGMKALFVAGNLPEADFKADTVIVAASHTGALTEKADIVLPLAALYEKQGSIINTYGAAKTFGQAQPAESDVKDGVETAASVSAAISKTKAITAKDVAAAVKKVKAGKVAAGAFRTVKAAAAKPYGASTTVLLTAMNEGMLSGSAVSKVISAKQPALQR